MLFNAQPVCIYKTYLLLLTNEWLKLYTHDKLKTDITANNNHLGFQIHTFGIRFNNAKLFKHNIIIYDQKTL